MLKYFGLLGICWHVLGLGSLQNSISAASAFIQSQFASEFVAEESFEYSVMGGFILDHADNVKVGDSLFSYLDGRQVYLPMRTTNPIDSMLIFEAASKYRLFKNVKKYSKIYSVTLTSIFQIEVKQNALRLWQRGERLGYSPNMNYSSFSLDYSFPRSRSIIRSPFSGDARDLVGVAASFSDPSGFPKSFPNKIYANTAQKNAHDSSGPHNFSPPCHHHLSGKIILATLIFAGGCFFFLYAIWLTYRGQGSASIPYAILGLFSVIFGLMGRLVYVVSVNC